MDRRKFINRLFAAPVLAFATGLAVKGEKLFGSTAPDETQFPGTPQQGSMPPGAGPPVFQLPPMPKIDPKLALKEDQKKIQQDAKRLFELASKLEHQVEKTDSTEILSLNMIHTTKEIENLAKHIRSLARGS